MILRFRGYELVALLVVAALVVGGTGRAAWRFLDRPEAGAAGGPTAAGPAELILAAERVGDRLPPVTVETDRAPLARLAGAQLEELRRQFRIDLNRATMTELVELPGIGAGKAQQILEFRQRHGKFSRLEELGEIPGMGKATVEALRSFVKVEGVEAE